MAARKYFTALLATAVAFSLEAGQAGSVNLVTNGDFEDTTGWTAGGGLPAGWSGSTTIAVQQSGADAIGGSGTSAYLPYRSTAGAMTTSQNFAKSGSLWQFDLDFASEDPLASSRTLNVLLTAQSGDFYNKAINLRVAAGTESGRASVQVYDTQLSWSTPVGLANCVLIDDDVTDVPLVHHLQIVGDYRSTSPFYTITVVDSLSNTFSETRSHFYGSEPVAGDGILGIRFVAYNDQSPKSYDYLIDNVSLFTIPEPTTLVLLGGAATLLLVRRRRKGLPIS